MSFRVIVSGRRFAIDGELNAGVRAERERLTSSSFPPLAAKSLDILKNTVDELLRTSPHDCDVQVDLWGERNAEGHGGVTLKLSIVPHVDDRPAPVAAEAVEPEPIPAEPEV